MSSNNEIWYTGSYVPKARNSLRQQKRVIYVCAYKYSILPPITMKFGTQGYCTMTYLANQQLYVCKQQQTASGNKHL